MSDSSRDDHRIHRRGVAWMTYSYIAGFGLQGVYFLLLARSLGPEQFGVFSGALALATVVATMAGLGSGHLMVIAVARDRTVYGKQLGTFFAYLGITFVPLFAIGLALAFFGGPEFVEVAAILLVSEIVFTRAIDFVFQTFQAHDRLSVTANLNVLVAAARCVSVIVVTWLFSASALTWAVVYAGINVALGVAFILAAVRIIDRPRWDRQGVMASWRTGVFFSLGMSSRIVYTDGDKYLLNAFGQAELAGQYSAASRLVNLAFAPIQALVYASNTAMFRAGSAGYRSVWHVCRRILSRGVILAAIASVGLFVCSPLLPILLGSGYGQAAGVLRMISGVPILMAVHLSLGDALMGVGRQSVRALGQALMAVVGVVVNLLLIPHFGIQGVVVTLYVVHVGLVAVNTTAFVVGYRRESSVGSRE